MQETSVGLIGGVDRGNRGAYTARLMLSMSLAPHELIFCHF